MSVDTPRVALVDDEFHMRAFIAALLETLGVDVVGMAADGKEAVALYRKTRPDLVLLDINLPIQTGIEALAEIRAEFPGATVIMLTSMTDQDSVTRCLELGAANVIRKDSPLDEIKAIIRETLDSRAGPA